MSAKLRQHLDELAPPERFAGIGLIGSAAAADDFPFLVPPSYRRKIELGADPEPLIRQVLPTAREMDPVPGFTGDPLRETPGSRNGLIEKYAGRLLVMVTRACSGHCRFCFRRRLPGTPVRQDALQDAFRARMDGDDSISEVILSGGDPLVLSDARLESWFALAARYPQVERIRIHTREPVFSPERITPALAAVVSRSPLPVVVAVHVNHPGELDGETAAKLALLRGAGAMLVTQTVLLKDVNDDAETLAALFERALECGMLPYYLHQLDRVAGAAHFEVGRARGLEIMDALRRKLPGYLVPRYVEEVPGDGSKRPVSQGEWPCP